MDRRPGQRGFEGVANLLTGKENPSGHLTDTYAANSLSSPAAYTQSQNVAEWSNVDEVLNSGIVTDSPLHVSYTATQAEGIYVGYKYYETRYEDSILNPASVPPARQVRPLAAAGIMPLRSPTPLATVCPIQPLSRR